MSAILVLKNTLIKNIEISFYETDGEKADILLLHGWAHSKELWKSIIMELGKDYRVIVPDLPGFGDSSKPDIKYSYDFFLDVFSKFWEDTRNPDTPSYIIGHSFGGALAVGMATKYSFKKLVLVSTPITPIFLAKPSLIASYKMFAVFQGFTPLVKFIAQKSVKESKYATDLMVQTAQKFSNRAGADVLSYLANVNLKAKISALTIPTLFIIGENDNFVSCDQYKMLDTPNSKNFQILRYSNCGHTPFMEKECKFLADVNCFLTFQ